MLIKIGEHVFIRNSFCNAAFAIVKVNQNLQLLWSLENSLELGRQQKAYFSVLRLVYTENGSGQSKSCGGKHKKQGGKIVKTRGFKSMGTSGFKYLIHGVTNRSWD